MAKVNPNTHHGTTVVQVVYSGGYRYSSIALTRYGGVYTWEGWLTSGRLEEEDITIPTHVKVLHGKKVVQM